MDETMPAIKIHAECDRRPLHELKPHARNSRTHSEAQIEQLVASIREWGFTNPILIDEHGSIIAGHARHIAAERLGMVEAPVITVGGLTDAQQRALIIADNKIALNAGWDDQILSAELQGLADLDFDLSLIGFSDAELKKLMSMFSPVSDPGQVVGHETRYNVSDGDIWAIGRHRMICGSAGDEELIKTALDGREPDTVIYDPPYELAECWEMAWCKPRAFIAMTDYKHLKPAMDLGCEYLACYQFIWDNMTSWFTPNRPLARHKAAIVFLHDAYWDVDAAIIHDGKSRTGGKRSNKRGAYEYLPLQNGFTHLSTVYSRGKTGESNNHPHEKPVEWLRGLMLGVRSRLVLDQFAGSGAVAVAAPDQTDVVGVEIDPHQCGLAMRRIAVALECEPRLLGNRSIDGRQSLSHPSQQDLCA